MASNLIRHASRRRPPRRGRRGVVLLVVLSLLVLFVIVGLTFAVVASVYRRSAESASRGADRYDDAIDELDRVMYMALRDTAHVAPLQSHSLLRDLHGNFTLESTLLDTSPTPNPIQRMGGELLEVTLSERTVDGMGNPLRDPVGNLLYPNDRLAGCLLTVTSGPALHRTFRIVYSYQGGGRVQLMLAPTSGDVSATLPTVNDAVLITGRPFSGTGAGYEPFARDMVSNGDTRAAGSGGTDPLAVVLEGWRTNAGTSGPHVPPNQDVEALRGTPAYTALMPNQSAYPVGVTPLHRGLLGGVNEDWDAPDFQNMFLAWMPPAASAADELIPSFHRPALVRYWFHWLRANFMVPAGITNHNDQWGVFNDPLTFAPSSGSLTATDRTNILALKRRIILRPLAEDHPAFASNFAGVNPVFTLAGFGAGHSGSASFGPNRNPNLYQWDVDNDGDGRKDSIWIDPQLGIKKAPDGRLYKTLAAMMIIDLDNRLDVSVHDRPDPPTGSLSNAAPARPFRGVTQLQRMGQGVGPAEISLEALGLAAGVRANLITGRYHHPGMDMNGDGDSTDPSDYPEEFWPGFSRQIATTPPAAPIDMRDDLLSFFDQRGLAGIAATGYLHPGSRYRSVPDYFGVRLTTVDIGGNPIVSPAPSIVNDALDDPYEAAMLGNELHSQWDSPYTAADLEPLLRFYDHDRAGLSQRLIRQIGGIAKERRESITTLSRHIPISSGGASVNFMAANATAPATPPAYLRLNPSLANAPYPLTVTDLFRFRLSDRGLNAAQIETHIARMVAPELRRGEPLDINRPFGNMVDDDGNLVVDDIFELLAGTTTTHSAPGHAVEGWGDVMSSPAAASYGATTMDLNNDDPLPGHPGPPALAGNTPQQQMARHLFCLAMLLWENGYDIPFNQLDMPSPSSVGPRERELTVRRIAQWSVNAVDFRDPDAAMTIFEYDVDPWNGWNVNGIPGHNGSDNAERRVVIGMEKSEVALTEAVALHDVGARDTDRDDTGEDMDPGPNPDDDEDQYRFEQASLFLELLCTRAPSRPSQPFGSGLDYGAYNTEMPPAELYTRANANSPWALNLGRLSPARSDIAYPVWRVAITHTHTAQTAGEEITTGPYRNFRQSRSPESLARNNFWLDTVSEGTMTPEESSAVVPFERFVWFAGVDPAGSAVQAIRQGTFYNRTGTPPFLFPGQYAVVGPRPLTPIGSMDPAHDLVNVPPPNSAPSIQQFQIGGGTFIADSINGVGVQERMVPGINMRSVLGLIADRPRRFDGSGQAWTNTQTQFSGVNITEPLPNAAGQERVREPNRNNDPIDPPDAYIDLSGMSGNAPDTDEPFYRRAGGILDDYGMDQLRSYENVRTACLQRLANPLLPWNPFPGEAHYDPSLHVNPYVTVDWTSIDCTVFSGEDNIAPAASYHFGSSMRGIARAPDPSGTRAHLHPSKLDANTPTMTSPWWAVTRETNTTSPLGVWPGARPFMKHRLVHTLGYLNAINTAAPAAPLPRTSFLMRRVAVGPNDPYEGYPANAAFPWIKFNDRPYASIYELTQVPACSPSRLTTEFSMRVDTSNTPGDEPTETFMNPDHTAGPAYRNDSINPFQHLMNFHLGSRGGTSVRPNVYSTAVAGPNLFRIFDFMHTPSRFVDTKRWLNPRTALNDNNVSFLNPPYNRLLEFREPGRMNLNTMYLTNGLNSFTWNGLMRHFPEWDGAAVAAFIVSRQGFGASSFTDGDMAYLPTRFANPFRSSMAARHMPPVVSAVDPINNPGAPLVGLQRSDIDATLLRSRSNTPDIPLFHQQRADLPSVDRDPDHDAAFAYEGLQRLENLTTSRSNCYAVWITTGYFEVVKSAAVDTGHIDGYQIMGEMGADTGEIRRHRAFYIIDRSLPVGFQAGRNHNVDRAVLLRRVIE